MAKKNKRGRPQIKTPPVSRQTPRQTFGDRQRPEIVPPPPPQPKENP